VEYLQVMWKTLDVSVLNYTSNMFGCMMNENDEQFTILHNRDFVTHTHTHTHTHTGRTESNEHIYSTMKWRYSYRKKSV